MNDRLSIRTLFMILALVAIAAFFALYGAMSSRELGFLTPRNLSLLSIELAITAILALGMLLVILPGHVDLAAGSSVGLFGALAAMLVIDPAGLVHNLLGIDATSVAGWPAPLAMLASLAVALAIYAGMGYLVAYQGIPAFIITLGGLLALKGLHWQAIASATVPVSSGGQDNAYAKLTTYYLPSTVSWSLVVIVAVGLLGLAVARRRGSDPIKRELTWLQAFVAIQAMVLAVVVTEGYRGVPLAAVVLAIVACTVFVVTQKTPFGRYLYAIGGNAEAARLSGIRVERTTVLAFTCLGGVVGLTGLLQTAYAGSSTTTIGQLMELDAIAACVIGGASLKGGRGTVGGVLFGALIMAIVLNGMTLMAVSPEHKLIARGTILALAVWGDVTLSKRR